jgi:proteasome lid subunit RPN8/RPN11
MTHTAVKFSIDVVVPRIIELGMAKLPNEACGVVIPDLDRHPNDWVVELINRSADPTNSYDIDVATIKALHQNDKDAWSDCLVWHTHPSGHVGPSRKDLQGRIPGLSYLVVALPRGEAVIF